MSAPGDATVTATRGLSLCSVLAARDGQDPVGSVPYTQALLMVETPTPWGESFYAGDANGTVWQRIQAVQSDWFERRVATGLPYIGPEGYRAVYGIAPDPAWSRPDVCRAYLVRRPDGPFARYDMTEYRLPADSPVTVELARTVIEGRFELRDFEDYRQPGLPQRQLFVCTHGHVDICCARFGIPVYRQMRAAYPSVLAWRTTHFGGHRFAPTVMDYPGGYAWGFLDETATSAVLSGQRAIDQLLDRVRGWSGAPAPAQPVDREGLRRHGWTWLDIPRMAEIADADEEAGWWRVRLDYYPEPGVSRCLEGEVHIRRKLRDAGCGNDFGHRQFESPEYAITSLVASHKE